MNQPAALGKAIVERKTADLFIFITFLLVIFLMAARTPLDSDMWWHLRAGEETLRQGKPMLQDIFSFTRQGADWINHSWLAQVGMFFLYDRFGYPGLSAMVALAAAGMVACLFLQMEGPPIFRAFMLVLPAVVASFVWSPRPQVVSLVLMSLVGYLLYLYKWKKRDRLWILIPLFILWSNLHAGYVLGLILIGTMLAGEGLNLLLGYRDGEVLAPRAIIRLLLWGAACGFAVLLNPNGLQTWLIPFKTVGVSTLQNFVSEWASPDFHQLGQQSILWLLFACLGAIGFSGLHLDGTDFCGLFVFGMLAFLARRNFGPFALVAGPILARYAWPALLRWWERIRVGFPGAAAWVDRSLHPEQRDVLPPVWKKVLNMAIVGTIAGAAFIKLYVVSSPQMIASVSPTIISGSCGGVDPAAPTPWKTAEQL